LVEGRREIPVQLVPAREWRPAQVPRLVSVRGSPSETSRSTNTGTADLRQVVSYRWFARLSGEGRLPARGRAGELIGGDGCAGGLRAAPGSRACPVRTEGGSQRGNTPSSARRPGEGIGAECGLDGVGDELGGLRVDGDVAA